MVKLDRTNKFDPIYDPSLNSPYIITEITGNMIRAKRESPLHEITRNCSWFRHVNWKAQKTTITKPSPS